MFLQEHFSYQRDAPLQVTDDSFLTFLASSCKIPRLRGPMKKIVLTTLILICFSLFASAATKTVANRDGNCTVTVPDGWSVEATLGMAKSTDKKISIVVSSPKQGMATMDSVEQMAPTIYPDDQVTKKSATEFEMEGKSGNGKPNFYRAVPAGSKICTAEIQYESGTPADAKAIVETLKAK